ncbi:hypothetical protein E1B28_007690 [Marasmius oreades]|uniref:SUZ domain-containing protein n=1 Tax=Marasmius oreades TaxID=181124 RepID=A0A9P7UUA3_9AGAR|nr:uncharacterized protein E1B28_007690 [Marasmius oreades]KAG7094070.1 hypothetical protein E1B28_007690 [Marasmius oreades]
MSLEHIAFTPAIHPRHQISAFSEPNSRVPSPPPVKTMPESHPNVVTASSSATSLFASSSSDASSESPSPSITDAARSSSPTMSLNGSQLQNGEPATQPSQVPDVDPQILEALRNKDRLYVLKLGELMEGLIIDRNRQRVELLPSTSYQRMLVHRCSAYYKLTPDSDQISKMIYVSLTSESRIPLKRLADLVPAEPMAQPAFKIMRRTQQGRKPHSSTSSVTGEEADLSDMEPSEAGSMGGRSSAAGGSHQKRMTIEEREAAYQEARSRIFNDYEERGRDREPSASSSTLSLSASNSGGSVGDVDDSSNSLATESERSGPSFARRSANMSTPSSSRSYRTGFTSNGSGSSRDSRAASPSFTYASLYEPAVSSAPPYDPSATGYPPTSYMYHYQQPSNAPYPHYPYYPYPYAHIPPPSQNTAEASTPSEMYSSQPPPAMMYGPPYMWPSPPNQPPIHTVSPVQHQNSSSGQIPGVPQPPQPQPAQSQQQYYMPPPPHGYYPMPGYYTPPAGQPMHHPPPPGAPQFFDDTRIMNSSVPGNGNSNLYMGGEDYSQRSGGHGAGFNNRNNGRGGYASGKTRGGVPARSAWSYGPGIGMGGMPIGSGNSSSSSSVNGEAVGPRFNSSMRRISNTSAGSSGQYRSSSAGDEAASQTSSTSSSSRRTYTSTTSSQHPLPARPDWAVGLKPDLNHLHNGSRNLSPISPPRSVNGGSSHSNSPRTRGPQDQTTLPILQANDFPPLTSIPSEKRSSAPAVGGAWTNAASRSLLMTPPTGHGGQGNVHHTSQAPALQLGQHSIAHNNDAVQRLEDNSSYERPPPKATELYDPKAGSKRGRPNNGMHAGQAMGRGSFSPPETDIAEQLGSMSLSGDPGPQQPLSYPPAGLS